LVADIGTGKGFTGFGSERRKEMDILLIGAPGAGKGTQAQQLSQLFALRHVASGDLFHKAFEEQTELGLKAQTYVDLGELVPDAITIPMVMRHLQDPESRHGVLLDGYPRTLAQAQELDTGLQRVSRQIDLAIYLQVSRGEVLRRLAGRVFCQAQQHVYHLTYRPAQVAGRCDLDGSPLYQRSDDSGEAVRRRLVIFFDQTFQVLDYYRKQHKLREVDGNQSIDQVQTMLVNEINDYMRRATKA
jgi:adenylate kinase